MKIIISPAKKMNVNNDCLEHERLPVFIDKSKQLKEYMAKLEYNALKKLLECNDKIAELNYERYKYMNLNSNLTPAILAYEGIQYQYMAPQVFTEEEYKYIEKNLRILSGFYGILNPFDGVVPYRLEMQAKVKTDFCNNMYDFWKDTIYKELTKDDNIIINLASKEYSKAIEKYLSSKIKYVTCTFGTFKDGKIKVKATEAKMARGEMVRYMAENNIEDIENIKKFQRLNFNYSKNLSSENNYVFIREGGKEYA